MSNRIEEAQAVVAGVFDDAADAGVDRVEFSQRIVRALDGAGFLAPDLQQEWMAAVGWRNGHGQTEQNQGYGDTRKAALADARSQPRLLGLGDEDEAAYKALRRFVSSWEEA